MGLDTIKLQKIVDKIATPAKGGGWDLDHKHANQFFNYIEGYVRKAVYKSDRDDPESSVNEIFMHLWLALGKYGPRPNGYLFGNYTLKLKTNNVLTNLHRKRKSDKSKINYLISNSKIALSLEEIQENEKEGCRKTVLPTYLPIDPIVLKEYVKNASSKILEKTTKKEPDVESILAEVSQLTLEKKREVFYGVCGILLEQPPDEVKQVYEKTLEATSLLMDLKYCLYYKNDSDPLEDHAKEEETRMIDLTSVKIGDKFVSPGDKIFEIRGIKETKVEKTDQEITEFEFKVFVYCTNRETAIEGDYLQQCLPYVDALLGEKTTSEENKSLEEEVPNSEKEIVEDPIPPKKRLRVKPKILKKEENKKVEPSKKQKKKNTTVETKEKGEEDMVKKGDKMRKVIDLLKEGEQTRESLAQGLIDAGLSKENSLKKEKSYVSVILHNIKNDKNSNFVQISRGKYTISS